MSFLRRFTAASLLLGTAQSAHASETVTYAYDALGRVVQVSHAGSVNNGVTAGYSYDRADNRTNVTVTGAPAGPGGDGGATVPQSLFVVVPLNGYTVIKIR